MLPLKKNNFDVIVVGGGINGVGIARDLALRGINCLLVEKGDFSAGTSGCSSGMIHGGARYMLSHVEVTKLACIDSGYIQKVAPHLLFRIPFLYTVYKKKNQSRFAAKLLLEAVEGFFTAYDEFVAFKNGKKHTRLSPDDVALLEPNIPQNDLLGGVTFDEWGIDVPRLCIANVIDAAENGATVLNHTAVTRVLRDGNKVIGVRLHDAFTGAEQDVFCNQLVNATGPWSPAFGKMLGVPINIRGGKGIHITFDRRLFNIAIVSQCIDGREIFIMPYENVSVLGTTDDDYFGDLDNQRCLSDEIEYLLDGIQPVFPAIRSARMIRSWSGVRPTIYSRGVYEDNLSREHEILDHETRDGVKGVVSLIGGKLASYRVMSQEVADLIAGRLKNQNPCITHVKPLPGGENLPDVATLAKEYQINAHTVSRLVYRHGSRALRILDLIKQSPELGTLICACEPVTEAEIRYVMANEFAQNLSDVRRRTRLTLGPCQGTNCVIASGSILSEIKNESSAKRFESIDHFFKEWWYNRAIVLNADQLKQEELNQAVHFCNNSLDLCR